MDTTDMEAKKGAPPGLTIIRLPVVSKKLGGMGHSQIYERVASGDLPAPVSIVGGSAVGWIESEIDEYIAARMAARDADRAAGISRQRPWLKDAAAKAKAARPATRKAAPRKPRKATPASRQRRKASRR